MANLVENAVRYNQPDGWVSAWTGERDGLPTIEVANVGPVVEPADVDQLVKPFYRGGENGNGDGRGLGLGLSIVQAIAEAHGALLETEPDPRAVSGSVAFPVAAPSLS